MELVIATKNKGKFLEFQRMLEDIPVKLMSLEDFPEIEITEDGATFEENALLKAKITCTKTGMPALGDDSGLRVQALSGRPGVFTARYAGQGASDKDNIEKLLNELKDVPFEKRQAEFVCVLALVLPDGRTFIEEGTLEGFITFEPAGCDGFGYDPIFFVPQLGKTLAEAGPQAKDAISHRAKAIKKMKTHLINISQGGKA